MRPATDNSWRANLTMRKIMGVPGPAIFHAIVSVSAAVLAALGWALYLVNATIVLTVDDVLETDLTVACKSVFETGWNHTIDAESDHERNSTFKVKSGDLDKQYEQAQDHPWYEASFWDASDRMDSRCDRARTSHAAMAAFALAGAAVLGTLSLVLRDRRADR